MKAKVRTGGGMRGTVNYQNKDGSEFISGSQENASDFLRETAALRELRKDCKKPVLHFVLSQPDGKENNLTKEEWQQAISLFQKKMGLENHSFYSVRHNDEDHDHVHIAINKIGFGGKLWDTDKSAMRAMGACTEIENEMGLDHTRTLAEFRAETGRRRNIIRDGATGEFRRTGKVKSRVQLAIQERERKKNEQNRGTHQNSNDDADRLDKLKAPDHQPDEKVNRGGARLEDKSRKVGIIHKQESQQIILKEPEMFEFLRKKKDKEIEESDVQIAINHARHAAIGSPQNGLGAIFPTDKMQPPTMRGKLRSKLDPNNKNVHLLYWPNRDKPSFSYDSNEQKINLLAKLNPMNQREQVGALFDLAEEQGLDQPCLKIYGSDEFKRAAATEAAKRGINVEQSCPVVRAAYKNAQMELAGQKLSVNSLQKMQSTNKKIADINKQRVALANTPDAREDDRDERKNSQKMRG